ncbi:spore germination protein [Calditerricola satsumensis]|uniref:spore germination protein n=1 Tax=Calditerricola satsumensis TaxID=373054 RepID=UPI00166F09E6|nr:spore germination protein [Calditerricola satsumensis]
MWFFRRRQHDSATGSSSGPSWPSHAEDQYRLVRQAFPTSDLTSRIVSPRAPFCAVLYLPALVEAKELEQALLQPLARLLSDSRLATQAADRIPCLAVRDLEPVPSVEEARTRLVDGWAILFLDGLRTPVAAHLYQAPQPNVAPSEIEGLTIGVQESFVESLETNLGLLRKRIRSPQLRTADFLIGRISRIPVRLLWIEGIADPDYVQALSQRLTELDLDGVIDLPTLAQYIEDSSWTPFPLFLITPRPDVLAQGLLEGKVALLMEGSPVGLLAPARFLDFFQSREDYTNRWLSASLLRFLRLTGFWASTSLTAMYIAVTSWHYQMIPPDLLIPFMESREKVPFHPFFEALLLEVTVELLREAGSRLPSKVGQTIGIVGGIVIGQAAVQAGLTSNILVIIVAMGTIASFVAPNYTMANAMRAMRFPMMVCAALWGAFGIAFFTCLLVIHLIRQRSLGAPFLSPLLPFRLTDWGDTLWRFPLPLLRRRPSVNRAQQDQAVHRTPPPPRRPWP